MYNYLTQEAIDRLQAEIEHRKVVTRFKINQDLKEAKAHGDLSENFEYKAAKTDRARNESRIRFLERMIRTAHIIIDETARDEVGIGKIITVRFLDDDELDKYTIVTTIDADPLENRVSIESPVGRAIYKHKVNDEVEVKSPNGFYKLRIEEIYIPSQEEGDTFSEEKHLSE